MLRRTTIELDDALLERAKRALGCRTARATVEEALRRATSQAEDERSRRAAGQTRYLASLAARVDTDVLASDEMWR
jgi:Arc/MetJ family transcription regulator